MNDPLTQLVTNEEIDRQKLADLLKLFVGFNSKGEIYVKSKFGTLKTPDKIQILLLASKARFLLGYQKVEGLTPSQIAKTSGLPAGTVKPTMTRMRDNREVAVEDGTYQVPNYRVDEINSSLTKEKKHE